MIRYADLHIDNSHQGIRLFMVTEKDGAFAQIWHCCCLVLSVTLHWSRGLVASPNRNLVA